jgi:hypothetical protein
LKIVPHYSVKTSKRLKEQTLAQLAANIFSVMPWGTSS